MEFLTISKHWNHPQIEVDFSSKTISLRMKMADFKHALLEELGSPALMFTRDALSKAVDQAVETIVAKVKQESAKVK
jgi:hypothetical protein